MSRHHLSYAPTNDGSQREVGFIKEERRLNGMEHPSVVSTTVSLFTSGDDTCAAASCEQYTKLYTGILLRLHSVRGWRLVHGTTRE
jgi:hypothetical protein